MSLLVQRSVPKPLRDQLVAIASAAVSAQVRLGTLGSKDRKLEQEISVFLICIRKFFVLVRQGLHPLDGLDRATTASEGNMDQEQNRLSSPRPAPARRWASCSAATGFRPCTPRNCRRTNARRCASSCCPSGCSPGATREGRLALTDEFCAHRGVSLWFGRNEHNGLRCPYHGWKYDHTGQCIEVPSEPSESGFCGKIKLKSYPLIERGGILWAYMGPPELQPPLPEFEWAPSAGRASATTPSASQECNYLQAMEGGIDSSHVSFLHSGDMHRDPLHRNTKGAHYQADQKPKFEIVESVRRPVHRRAPQRRAGPLLLAHHPVDHALVHDGAALRPQRAQRPCLGADRRRELLHLDLHLSSDASAVATWSST